jgi:hypothetical protein
MNLATRDIFGLYDPQAHFALRALFCSEVVIHCAVALIYIQSVAKSEMRDTCLVFPADCCSLCSYVSKMVILRPLPGSGRFRHNVGRKYPRHKEQTVSVALRQVIVGTAI